MLFFNKALSAKVGFFWYTVLRAKVFFGLQYKCKGFFWYRVLSAKGFFVYSIECKGFFWYKVLSAKIFSFCYWYFVYFLSNEKT